MFPSFPGITTTAIIYYILLRPMLNPQNKRCQLPGILNTTHGLPKGNKATHYTIILTKRLIYDVPSGLFANIPGQYQLTDKNLARIIQHFGLTGG